MLSEHKNIPFLEMGYSLIEIDEEHVECSYNNRDMLKRNIASHNLFFWAPKSLQVVIAAMKLKDTYSLEGKL